MKLNCSCGSTSEFTDTFAGSVDARQWNETHAVCRLQQINKLCVDLAKERETLQTVRDYAHTYARSTHLSADSLRRSMSDLVTHIDIKMNEINNVYK